MLNFFGKKTFKKISEYPDTWSVKKGGDAENPLFIRFRTGLLEAVGHPDYKFQIGVAVPLLSPTLEGLTTNSEAEVLGRIEDKLVATLSENNECVFALTITTNKMREFVFYASEWKPEVLEKKVAAIDGEGHELQFMMQQDKNWDTFRQFER